MTQISQIVRTYSAPLSVLLSVLSFFHLCHLRNLWIWICNPHRLKSMLLPIKTSSRGLLDLCSRLESDAAMCSLAVSQAGSKTLRTLRERSLPDRLGHL